jgi:ribosomal protein S18 acetylase RimI-like enzyme
MPPGVKLRDGSRIVVRAVRPEDRQLIAAGFERLGETSRYRRFFTPMVTLTEDMLGYFTEIDHHDHEALLAIDRASGDGVGVARYVRNESDPDTAEAAVAVVDDWQGRGVGRTLMLRLAVRARQEGVHAFTAAVKVENPAAVELLRGLGRPEVSRQGTEFEIRIELPKRGIGAKLPRALRAAATGSMSTADSMTQRLAGRPWSRS